MQYFKLINPEREEVFDPPRNTYQGLISGTMDYTAASVGAQQALTYLETPVNWDGVGFQPLYNKLAEYGREAEQIDDPHAFARRRMDDTLNAEFGYAGRWATDRTLSVGDYNDSIDPGLFHADDVLETVADDYETDPDDLGLYQVARSEAGPYRDVTEAVQREVEKLQFIFRMEDLGEDALEEAGDLSKLERMDRAFSSGLPGELERVIDASDWSGPSFEHPDSPESSQRTSEVSP